MSLRCILGEIMLTAGAADDDQMHSRGNSREAFAVVSGHTAPNLGCIYFRLFCISM